MKKGKKEEINTECTKKPPECTKTIKLTSLGD
jgi:hypothetical protein